MSVKSELQEKVAAAVAALEVVKVAVDELPESDPVVEELEKKIKELEDEVVVLKDQIAAKDQLLASADALAKQIDAAIPDAPQA